MRELPSWGIAIRAIVVFMILANIALSTLNENVDAICGWVFALMFALFMLYDESLVRKLKNQNIKPTDLGAARKAFEESRLTHPMVGFKHDTFEDYLKWLDEVEKEIKGFNK